MGGRRRIGGCAGGWEEGEWDGMKVVEEKRVLVVMSDHAMSCCRELPAPTGNVRILQDELTSRPTFIKHASTAISKSDSCCVCWCVLHGLTVVQSGIVSAVHNRKASNSWMSLEGKADD